MRWRTIIWCIVLALVLVVVTPVALFFLYLETSGGAGSIEEANRLRPIVQAIANPDGGPRRGDGYASKTYPNGEWVLGIGKDSHGLMSKYTGGGTLVVKDSRGNVRCFFGHVCGGGGQSSYMERVTSLDEFYKVLLNDFTEQQWP